MYYAPQLFAKLNPTCTHAFEAALGLCQMRRHYEVDVDHLFLKLLQAPPNDVVLVLRAAGVNPDRWSAELQGRIDRFKSGNPREPVFSPNIPRLVSEAWLIASIHFGSTRIRSGHLLAAALSANEVARWFNRDGGEIRHLTVDKLNEQFATWTRSSPEEEPAATVAEGAATTAGPAGTPPTPALDRFTVDLTRRAREGHIDRIIGREAEVRQMVSILLRRRQNNPILTGEAGVGKTAIVEGFALRVARGDVPEALANVVVRSLDLALLQAGAGVRGEFEQRLRSVIDEVKASTVPIVLFIDEAHTLIGAGGAAGQNDAANLLKPALARGELRTIAATTREEFKKYFEKDDALNRRFTEIKVEEPSPEIAVAMLRHALPGLSGHHKVRIFDDAVESAVHLSVRYLTGRKLPDKAVSVLDTACARVALSQEDVPGVLEDTRQMLAATILEQEALQRDHRQTSRQPERLAELAVKRTELEQAEHTLVARIDTERSLVREVLACREALDQARDDGARAATAETLGAATKRLADLQGDSPLLHPFVDRAAVAEVVSNWTGIPVGKMKGGDGRTVLDLRDRLEQRVFGQSHALEAIAQRLQISRAGLEDVRKPVGVFFLLGPSGVGKTETALALADVLYGGEHTLITINMSEYQEAHTVSNLKGSPKGYVGYGEGGILTEAVRRRPYSVVLLDEVEKAHPDVLELFFQVFDKGNMKDGEGDDINFRNTVILLTSNVGTDSIMALCTDEETRPTPDALTEQLRKELLQSTYASADGRSTAKRTRFSPALLARMTLVPYYPISKSVLRRIVGHQLEKVRTRLHDTYRAVFDYDPAVVDTIEARCVDVDSGARNVEHIITSALLPEISRQALTRVSQGDAVTTVSAVVSDGQQIAVKVV